MKSRFALGFLGILAGLTGQTVSAQTVSDAFAYTAGGSLAGQNGGTGFSAAWGAGAATIASGSLTYTGLAPSTGNRAQISAANTTQTRTTTTTYGSFGADSTQLFFSFLMNRTATSTTADRGGVQFGGGFGGGLIFIGDTGATDQISLSTSTFTGVVSTGVSVGTNTTNLIVVGFNNVIGNDTISVWVNPTSLGGTAPTATLTNASFNAGASFDDFSLVTNSIGSGAYQFDQLRIGNSYSSVTPVPEPATLGLAATGLFAIGGIGLRRFRGRSVATA